MSEPEQTWVISEKDVWLPRQKPSSPFGVTQIEAIRSCPLRISFDASKTQPYEQRLDPAARLGLAFHATIEELIVLIPHEQLSPTEAADAAREKFQHALDVQLAEQGRNERERLLPLSQERVSRAISALIREARFISEAHQEKRVQQAASRPSNNVETARLEAGRTAMEFPIQSKDGMLKGRIDRIEWTDNGVRIVDYKSALRDDVPERYERQLQLYAWLWNEAYGEFPVEAVLIYPFVGTSHIVNIDPVVCAQVAADTYATIEGLMQAPVSIELAKPGGVCQVCQYRPYCKAFWRMQANETSLRQALDHAYFGFEGRILALDLQDEYWEVRIRWRDLQVTLTAPLERFPQLKKAKVGDKVRLLDVRLTGQYFSPRAVISDHSELFIVNS